MALMAALRTLLLLIPAVSPATLNYELEAYEPMADPSQVVTAGAARFTVLSPRLVRMEYDPAKAFEDRATLAIVNRKLPVPKFTASDANGAAQKSAQIVGAILAQFSDAARPLQAS